MRYNKEVIYHFSCEKCVNWWSYPSSDDLYENDFHDSNTWFCPHCAHEHKPPHTDQHKISPLSDEFLETFRENE